MSSTSLSELIKAYRDTARGGLATLQALDALYLSGNTNRIAFAKAAYNLQKTARLAQKDYKKASQLSHDVWTTMLARGPLLAPDIHERVRNIALNCYTSLTKVTGFTQQLKNTPASIESASIGTWSKELQGQIEHLHAVRTVLEHAKEAPEEQRRNFRDQLLRLPKLEYASNETKTGFNTYEEFTGPSLAPHQPTTPPPKSWWVTKKEWSRELISAAANNSVELMKHCIAQGADINHQSRSKTPKNGGMAAIHIAADHGHFQALEVLINYGADINAVTSGRRTALHIAARKGYSRVVQYLISSKANLNARDEAGQTPLMGSSQAIQIILLKAGADPNIPGYDVNTALHYASYLGWVDVVQQLVACGADVNACNKNEQTPLWFACTDSGALPNRSLEIAKILVASSASPNAVSKIGGRAPFHEAIRTKNPELVALLLGYRPDFMLPAADGSFPLHIAARLPEPDIVTLLIPRYENIDIRGTAEDNTAFLEAIISGQTENAKVLLSYGASLELCTGKGACALQGPLHHAFRFGDATQLTWLVDEYHIRRQSIREVDGDGRYPIHWASTPNAVNCWFIAGENIDVKDKHGNTPLHLLVLHANIDVVKRLVEHGADVKAKNDAGLLPIEQLCLSEIVWTSSIGDGCCELDKGRLAVLKFLHQFMWNTRKCRDLVSRWENFELRKEMERHFPRAGLLSKGVEYAESLVPV